MRVIVAGSRSIKSYEVVAKAISDSGIAISVLISGGAIGVDTLAEEYAEKNNISSIVVPAVWWKWATLHSGPKVKVHDPLGGFKRNERMAKMADALIAVWDGKSGGTKHMIKTMLKAGKLVKIIEVPRG